MTDTVPPTIWRTKLRSLKPGVDHGRFRLGRIVGPYRYENTEQAKRTDTHQVRDSVAAPTQDVADADAVVGRSESSLGKKTIVGLPAFNAQRQGCSPKRSSSSVAT